MNTRTTAGTRQSFAYEKMREVMGLMAEGKSAFNMGAGYELAVMHGQLDIDFINEVRESPNTNPMGFAREYQSVWTGSSDNSLVSLDDINKCRVLETPEDRAIDKNAEYVLAYDVARVEGKQNANSALAVFKIIDRGDGTYQKHVVNIFSFEGTHFRDQAIMLKKKVNEYKARMLVVDANGLGRGLVDELVLEIDSNPAYEVVNDPAYDKYKTENSIPMIFSITSQSKEMKASDIHNIFMNTVSNHGVKFLVTESQAKSLKDIKTTKDEEDKAMKLLPYTMTDFFQEEVMNLEYFQSGTQTKVKQVSGSIQKDKFSAVEYGLFYIRTLEVKNKTRRQNVGNIGDFFFGRKASAKLR